MKKVLFSLMILLSMAVVSNAMEIGDYDTITLTKDSDPAPYCPSTKISDNKKCMDCHEMIMKDGKATFGLKEISPSAGYNLPYSVKLVSDDDNRLGLYWTNNGTRADSIRDISEYMYRHPEFKFLIMEMDSPGGSVMDAWRAVGIIEEMRGKGIEIETRCYGMAASAGTILFVSGDIGKRFVNPHAEIMLHKLWTFAMFSLEDPDTAEDKADLMKHLQNNINNYILGRTNLSRETLEKNVYKKDWWVTGKECVELGIADGFIK